MTKTIAIRLAVSGLVLISATACDGDGGNAGAGSSSAPPTVSTPSASATGAAPPSAAPTTSAAPTPRATPTDPKITNSGQIVMIDPDGKRYTFTTMAQMAAGMRATMGENAPSGFCEKSYRQGVEGGGSFPAGRDAFLAACREGWRKSERWMRQQ
ncbi:hypothetical protein [Actinomadura mexicana]|uniref:Uncharacterized protein n=1 Tax=Actinomadura mexicana TaxID=134959 RepID=A0A239BWG0_9ACTN|nr:hypothetical protein [Actinomadura mexicana]SNS12347.1 hypothetical protein SAMN06265355_111152 [Actinomadura mexicana]